MSSPCQCPECKPRSSCSKKKKCPTCDHRSCKCPPQKCTKERPCPPEDALECCRCVELARTIELEEVTEGNVGPPVLMLNDGDDFSRKRTLQVEACTSVAATDDAETFPVTAFFQVRVDGELEGPVFAVVLSEPTADTVDPCDARICLKVRVEVGAGIHGVELLAWADGAMDLVPQGECGAVTFLKVCTVPC